jgi:superoxide dismutase, Fe-Mn family
VLIVTPTTLKEQPMNDAVGTLTSSEARGDLCVVAGLDGVRRPVQAANVDEHYVLAELPWDAGVLEPYCGREMTVVHHDQHHAAHVDRANRALEQLDGARRRREWLTVTQLETDLAVNLSEHALHTIFWTNLAPPTGARPQGMLGAALDDRFGSFDAFRERFTSVATEMRAGGWVTLAWDPCRRAVVIEPIHDHHSVAIRNAHLLLVCDVWAHAYALQYGEARTAWLEAFWEIVDWRNVERRLIAQLDQLVLEPYTL